jgi:hypothetical protein
VGRGAEVALWADPVEHAMAIAVEGASLRVEDEVTVGSEIQALRFRRPTVSRFLTSAGETFSFKPRARIPFSTNGH